MLFALINSYTVSDFLTGYSTGTALTTNLDDIFRGLEQDKLACLVLLF